jgi:hypothetical protein
VIVSQPPYALSLITFRFPALAALAGRAPLGGQREVALAAYLAAKLAHDALPDGPLTQPLRGERAASAKSWLSTLALPAAVRPALMRLIDASAGDRRGVAEAVRGVLSATAGLLDARARSELDQLAGALERR